MNRGHHEVFGSAHARKVKGNRGAVQSLGCRSVDVAVIEVKLNPECLETQDMHINLARTNVAAAGHGNRRFAKTGQKRSQHRS